MIRSSLTSGLVQKEEVVIFAAPRIANDDHLDRLIPTDVVPEADAREHPSLEEPSALSHRHGPPSLLAAGGHVLRAREALTLLAGPAASTRPTFRRKLVQRGVPPDA